MILDRKKKLRDSTKLNQILCIALEKQRWLFPYKWIISSEELFSIVLLNTLV